MSRHLLPPTHRTTVPEFPEECDDSRRPPPARHGGREGCDDDEEGGGEGEVRLRCIVRGGAGAGKTSLIRRYVRGGAAGKCANAAHDGECDVAGGAGGGVGDGAAAARGRRGNCGTRGADYYVRRVDKLVGEEGSACRKSRPTADHDDHDDCDARCARHAPRRAVVQLWDTVGRETLGPRRRGGSSAYDSGTNFYQFLSIGRSSHAPSSPRGTTNGGRRRREHRYNDWGYGDGGGGLRFTTSSAPRRDDADGHTRRGDAIRCGRVRGNWNDDPDGKDDDRRCRAPTGNAVGRFEKTFAAERPCRIDDVNNEPMRDALFRNTDACMLVYDAT
jgi:hypothetical protein